MKRALVIHTDGTVHEQDIEGDELVALQSIVGGWIEYVPTPQDVTLYCNEEGKILGLPPNPRATMVFGSLLGPGDYLAGDVVILGPINREGESESLDVETWIGRV